MITFSGFQHSHHKLMHKKLSKNIDKHIFIHQSMYVHMLFINLTITSVNIPINLFSNKTNRHQIDKNSLCHSIRCAMIQHHFSRRPDRYPTLWFSHRVYTNKKKNDKLRQNIDNHFTHFHFIKHPRCTYNIMEFPPL